MQPPGWLSSPAHAATVGPESRLPTDRGHGLLTPFRHSFRNAPEFLPELVRTLRARNVELRGDDAARAIVPGLKPATDADWDTEYLDLIMGVKIVKGPEEAIDFINTHGSHHSDAIIATDPVARAP